MCTHGAVLAVLDNDAEVIFAQVLERGRPASVLVSEETV